MNLYFALHAALRDTIKSDCLSSYCENTVRLDTHYRLPPCRCQLPDKCEICRAINCGPDEASAQQSEALLEWQVQDDTDFDHQLGGG